MNQIKKDDMKVMEYNRNKRKPVKRGQLSLKTVFTISSTYMVMF